MAVHTLDPKNVINSIGGHILSGYGDDMVSIEYPEDVVDIVAGCDGDITRILKARRDVKITVTLKQTSKSNQFLSALATTDAIAGAGVLPWLTKDNSPAGTSLVAAAQCFVTKVPAVAYGNAAKDSVWELHTGPAVVNLGGN